MADRQFPDGQKNPGADCRQGVPGDRRETPSGYAAQVGELHSPPVGHDAW